MTTPHSQKMDIRPRVLCVDDDPEVLAALQMTLRRRFDVETAGNGVEGLQVLDQQGPFTVVVSDFRMPGMNGAQFLSQVRVKAPDTIRMLLTGHASVEGAIDAINHGNIFRLLTKPCPPRQLIKTIDDAIEERRLQSADRADAQQRLDEMSAHVQRAAQLAMLGTMAGAVGHELNNTLMVFGGVLALIEDDLQSGKAPDDSDLGMLRHAHDRVAAHARNLLHLGRPADANGASEAEVCAVTRDVLAMLRAASLLKCVDVQLRLPDAPAIAACAPTDIEQILVNLLKNAIEALADGKREDSRVEISVTAGATSPTAVFLVSDNGPGIPAATLPMLFEPYYTTKPAERGSGLGLFVVRQIAQRAGGDVTVESTVGTGTTFTVTLPLVDTLDSVSAAAADFAPVPLTR
jgi:two-component system, NtrC family, sensor kinase